MMPTRISLLNIGITIPLLLGLCSQSAAATRSLTTLAPAEIQEAINSASAGDSILLPPGAAVWNQGVEITKPILLSGAGKDKTVITVGRFSAIRVTASRDVHICQLSINGGNYSGQAIHFRAPGTKDFRVSGCRFSNCGRRTIVIEGYSHGVIDHNDFIDNSGTDVTVYGDNDAAWARPVSLGSGEAVFIEDNYFRHHCAPGNSHSVASNHGARYVFRHNFIEDTNALFNTEPIDAHGNYFYGRGTVSYEIYGNLISSAHSYRGMYIRGGTGVIYDNILTGDFTHGIVLANYRSFVQAGSPCGYDCCSYPCPDQINQLYIWNNTINGTEVHAEVHDRGLERVHIQESRDFFSFRRDYSPFVYPHPLTIQALQREFRSSGRSVK